MDSKHPIIKATMEEAYKLYFESRDDAEEAWEDYKDEKVYIGWFITCLRGRYLMGHARRY